MQDLRKDQEFALGVRLRVDQCADERYLKEVSIENSDESTATIVHISALRESHRLKRSDIVDLIANDSSEREQTINECEGNSLGFMLP